MDELTRQILLDRLQDPQWLEGILAPYSETTPKGRTPRLVKEGETQQPRAQKQEQRNLFWRPGTSGVNARPSTERLIRQFSSLPETGINKNYTLPGGFDVDLSGDLRNFEGFIPRTYSGEAGLGYNTPSYGGRIGTTLRGNTLGGDPMQELLFSGYLNNLFGGTLSGGASSTVGIPGSTRANLQYNRQF
ncbi:MAG: hypothetical protein ACKJRP_03940 [SAR86 cluster bacterium]|tara:strand:+ start:1341 stop:1907 length:567 start_codon:yes stop_codon:yes gene_type:complete